MKTFRRRASVAVGAAILLCLSFAMTPLAGSAVQAKSSAVKVVPTEVCSCASRNPAPGTMQFRGHGPPVTSSIYDEQIGLTFTQSFTSMEYNITAVKQNDTTLGDGPAYLLSGLSSAGYWYQVGVSWNWAPGENPGTGFDMNYEVFDNSGNSVFPTNGQGGIMAFSGPVNAGDVVLLNLFFSNSTQSVVMLAEDTNSGATATQSYSDRGATYFMGSPDSVASQNGFFTGLMTEWYHGVPYYANEAEVVYSNPSFAITSGWMWMDEFDAKSLQSVFSAGTPAPVSYTDPAKLQEFSFNGTTEYSDAYEFVTGALTNGTRGTSTSVALTLSFTVRGGGAGYSPPVLTYVSNGTSSSVPLTETPTVYNADVGTSWSVSPILGGSTSGERWDSDQPTSGLANSSRTVQFVYFNQEFEVFGFSVSGGGAGFSSPVVTYAYFGSSATTPVGVRVWADAGSSYQYPVLLSGSTQSERWYAKLDGTIGTSQQINATYYHEYLVIFDISFRNTQAFPGLSLSSTSAGAPYSATLVSGSNEAWLDSGSSYNLPQSTSQMSGERMITNGTRTGSASANLVVTLVYVHQFYINITQNSPGGGTVSLQSGWYDSGSNLKLDALAASGWQFEGWFGVGADSASSANASLSLTVGPGSPADESALFYPGVAIRANGPASVSYSDGSITGSVSPGKSAEVYVPPSSKLTLTASGAAVLTGFKGWAGASNSTDSGTSFVVEGPATVTSNSEYSYVEIGILVAVIALVAIAATFVLVRRRRSAGVIVPPASAPSIGTQKQNLPRRAPEPFYPQLQCKSWIPEEIATRP